MAKPKGCSPVSRQKPPREVKVLEPIKITAIEWKRDGEYEDPVVTRVHLNYRLSYHGAPAHPSLQKAFGIQSDGPTAIFETDPQPLEVYPNLAFRDSFESFSDASLRTHSNLLKQLITVGTLPDIAPALEALSDDPAQNDPFVLETGILAKLIQYGIKPGEVWVFLLNHGAARPKIRAVVNASEPTKVHLSASSPWMSDTARRRLLLKAIQRCRLAAKTLRTVQESGVEVLPLGAYFPPLAPETTADLITNLELCAVQLETFLPSLKQSRHRPTDPDATAFCRDWYQLAIERTGHPLYTAGAALFSLIFRDVTVGSFRVQCSRARQKK